MTKLNKIGNEDTDHGAARTGHIHCHTSWTLVHSQYSTFRNWAFGLHALLHCCVTQLNWHCQGCTDTPHIQATLSTLAEQIRRLDGTRLETSWWPQEPLVGEIFQTWTNTIKNHWHCHLSNSTEQQHLTSLQGCSEFLNSFAPWKSFWRRLDKTLESYKSSACATLLRQTVVHYHDCLVGYKLKHLAFALSLLACCIS